MDKFKIMIFIRCSILVPAFTLAIHLAAGKQATTEKVDADQKEFRCDYKYNQLTDGFYKLHKIPANFHEARLRCHLEGATLGSPLDARMLRAQAEVIRAQYYNFTIYTGLHSLFSTGDIFTIEGTHTRNINQVWDRKTYTSNHSTGVILRTDLKLLEVPLHKVYPYLCYKRYHPSMQINECGTIDDQYKLDARTGSCYKLHVRPRPWSRAFMACACEGAQLAVPDHPDEAAALRDLFAQYTDADIEGFGPKDLVFIGVHDWGEPGDWMTVNGQPIDDQCPMQWAAGQPNNGSLGGESCGAADRAARLADAPCARALAFICEKRTDSLRNCFKSIQKLRKIIVSDHAADSSTIEPSNTTTMPYFEEKQGND